MKKHVHLIESVPGRATKLVSELGELNYESRPRVLKCPTLAYGWKIGTMTEMYELTNLLFDNSACNRLLEPNAYNLLRKTEQAMSKEARIETRRYCFTV